jgi:hypothetical protein
MRDREWAGQLEIPSNSEASFSTPQQSEKVHQDVALSRNSSSREYEDYQRASGSG